MAARVRCVSPFLARVPGRGRVRVTTGSVFPAGDPVVAAHPDRFAPIPDDNDEVVEQATAGPGEKRTTKPRKGKAKDAAQS